MTKAQRKGIATILEKVNGMYHAKTTANADRSLLGQYMMGVEATLDVLGYEARFNPFDGTFSIERKADAVKGGE